jgi:hypothetical protein
MTERSSLRTSARLEAGKDRNVRQALHRASMPEIFAKGEKIVRTSPQRSPARPVRGPTPAGARVYSAPSIRVPGALIAP